MFRVLTCLTTQHDWRLVVIAGLICFAASLGAIGLLRRARRSTGRVRATWVVIAGCVTGFGIWATHFIAMLAYDPGIAISYRIGLTALALLAGIAITCSGIAVIVYGSMRWRLAAGGAIVGIGIAAMHYIGMSSVEIPGYITWSWDLVVASIVLGIAFGIAAFEAAERYKTILGTCVAALLLIVAINSHHFTAMG